MLHPTSPRISLSTRLQPPKDSDKRPPPGEYDPGTWNPKDQLPVTMKFR